MVNVKMARKTLCIFIYRIEVQRKSSGDGKITQKIGAKYHLECSANEGVRDVFHRLRDG